MKCVLICALGLFVGVVGTSPSYAEAPDRGHTSTLEWVVQKVCADGAGAALAVDPYPRCPAGSRARLLKVGEALPYRRVDNADQLYKDVFPSTAPDGSTLAVATFAFSDPHDDAGRFRIAANGYDTMVNRDGWISVSETRNGTGEFGTSFMGAGCLNHGGLVYFPSPALRAPDHGKAVFRAAGVPWEADGEPWPGSCSQNPLSDVLTSWETLRDYPFAGQRGQPVKAMDAIVSTVGMRSTESRGALENWTKAGHLERFYFTSIYGLTRWELWRPRSQVEAAGAAGDQLRRRASAAAKACGVGPNVTVTPASDQGSSDQWVTMSYEGMEFVIADCRDWSNVIVQDRPWTIPAWPVSGLNALRNFHFDGDGCNIPGWTIASCSRAITPLLSATADDKMRNSAKPLRGARYLRVACDEDCVSQSLSQDVPVGPGVPAGGDYFLGMVGRVEQGAGVLNLTVTQIDAAGETLASNGVDLQGFQAAQRSCDASHKSCKTYSFDGTQGSVVLASDFLSGRVSLPSNKNTKRLRFTITTKGKTTFNLVSAWMLASPE